MSKKYYPLPPIPEWSGSDNTWYCRDDPTRPDVRWYVEYLSGKLLKDGPGWYWYTRYWNGEDVATNSSQFGPFSSREAAQADCEVACR